MNTKEVRNQLQDRRIVGIYTNEVWKWKSLSGFQEYKVNYGSTSDSEEKERTLRCILFYNTRLWSLKGETA